MRLWKIAVLISLMALGLAGYVAFSKRPAYDVRQIYLTGLLKRKADVFAVNPDGIYRATLAPKRWVKLNTPPEMPFGGTFAQQPEDSSLVFYVAVPPDLGRSRPAVVGPHKYGLYLSRDDGATWTLVSERPDFGAVLVLPDGAVFATMNPFGKFGNVYPTVVSRSADQGKTWRDITGKTSLSILGLFPDPDHPHQVCLNTWGIRNYVAQAPDENYEWVETRERVGQPKSSSSNDFFDRTYSSTADHMVTATLANYFDHDFGSHIRYPGMEILPQGDRFQFRQGERLVIPIRVVLHQGLESLLAEWRRQSSTAAKAGPAPTLSTEKLVDQVEGTDLWGIRVEKGEERVTRWSARAREAPDSKDKGSGPEPVRAISLSAWTPYDRTIDLGNMFDFSKPGEYRVQLIYSCGNTSDRSRGEWEGSFTSPVFRVVIKK